MTEHAGTGLLFRPKYSILFSDRLCLQESFEILRKRFDDELIDLLLKFRWWDKSTEEIDNLIPILTCSDLDTVRKKLKELL